MKNNEFSKEQCAIIDKCKEEKRSMSIEEVAQMNAIVEKRSLDEKEEKEKEEKSEPEDDKKEETQSDAEETPVEKEDEKEEKSCSEEDKEKRSDEEDEEEQDKEDKEDETSDDPDDKDKEENKKENRNININMEFSILKAINNIVNNRAMDAVTSAANEKGLAEMRKSGLNYAGQILIPVEELRSVTVTDNHDDTVAVDLWDVMAPLRAKNVLSQAGAKFMTGLVGDIQVPTMTAGNCYWEGETVEAQESEYSFSSVKMSPKRLTCFVDISKQFIAQDSVGAEALIRQDIVNALNAKLETTILGDLAGTTTQPAGIFAGETLKTIAGYEDICDLESDIEDANVFGEMKYVMSNKAKAALRCMAKSEHNQYVLENNTVDGTPYINTSNLKGKNLVYGDFSQLAIAQWGAVDLVVDPYTQATKGMIRLVINAYFDAKVLRPEAFVFGTVGATVTEP